MDYKKTNALHLQAAFLLSPDRPSSHLTTNLILL